MEKRMLGDTGIAVSPIGLGTVKFGRTQGLKYKEAFNLPSDKTIHELLAIAKGHGINLLDTAPAYGISESRIGQLLTNRDDWVISTKVGEIFENSQSRFDFSAKHTKESVHSSLTALKTDYLDCVLVHSNGDDLTIIEETDILATLADLKQQGLIRAFGVSTKTVEGGLLALQKSDIAMATYNLNYTAEKPVIASAADAGKGILIKKALASGHLDKLKVDNPVAASLQFVLAEPGVSSLILGTANPAHLREACCAINLPN